MRVLVTGNQGYLGAAVVDHLLAAGHEVAGLDAGYFAECSLPALRAPEAATSRVDIRDVALEHVAGFDAVVHLAALSNDPLGNFQPELTAAINYAASVRLAKAAKQAGVRRFVYFSSCSMYGAAGSEPLNESATLNPLTPYALSKANTEGELRTLASESFSPIIMRNATAYGLAPRLRLDLVLNDFVASAYATGEILIKSDGTPWRPIVHADDIAGVCAALLAAPRPAIHNQVFNVGAEAENYQVRDLADIVQQVVPRSRVVYAAGGEPDPRSYRVDFRKLREALPDFRFTTAKDGARALFETLCRCEVSAGELGSAKFIRLQRLQQLVQEGRIDEQLRWRT